MELSEMIYKILHFTNTVDLDDLVIEKCGEYNSKLDGYFICLHRDRFPSMQMFLEGEFPKHKAEIDEAFTSEDDNKILQCCRVYYSDSLTEKFIDKARSIDNLVKFGPSGEFSLAEQEITLEEEDEEMIAELQQKIEDLESKLQASEAENAKLKSRIPTGLDDEVVSLFLDILENEDPKYARDAVYNAIMDEASNGDEDGVSIMIGTILEQFMKDPETAKALGLA